MLGPFGHDRIGLLLHLSKVDPSRLTDGERGRGLGAGCDVHLLWGGQFHGLVLRRLEDTGSTAGNEGAPMPTVPPWKLDRAESTEEKQVNDEKRQIDYFLHFNSRKRAKFRHGDKNFKWFYQLNWRNIVMENKKKRWLIAKPCTQWSIETDVSLLSEGESQECGVEQMRWRTSLSLLRHPALHWFKYADWYKIQHLAAHTERSELPQKPERSEKKYLYPGESAGFQHRLLSKCGVIFI